MRGVRRRPLVGRPGGAGDGRRRGRRAAPTRTAASRPTRLEATRRRARRPTIASALFAIVATAGTTNAGVVDDLAATAADAAPSSARGCTSTAPTAGPPSPRRASAHRFAGVERADSFIVDPHKWLFAPFDSCALLYRDPEIGRRAHTQHAEYLDVLHADHERRQTGRSWNASDYAHHLSRRARGLPLWFSLATHGTDAYTEADRDDAAASPASGADARARARRTSS